MLYRVRFIYSKEDDWKVEDLTRDEVDRIIEGLTYTYESIDIIRPNLETWINPAGIKFFLVEPMELPEHTKNPLDDTISQD